MGLIYDDEGGVKIKYSRNGVKRINLKSLSKGAAKGKKNISKSLSATNSNTSKKSPVEDRRQNVVLKARYKNNCKTSTHEKMIDYILDENKKLSSKDDDLSLNEFEQVGNVTRKEFLDVADKKAYHFIVSPGSNDVDNKKLVNDFMSKLEVSTGQKMNWIGGVHYDTGQTHSHLYINGKDQKGDDVAFNKRYISSVYRNNLRDMATEQIGERTDEEIERAKELSLLSKRFVTMDKFIKEEIANNSKDLKTLREEMDDKDYNKLIKRLDYLSSLGLCDKNRNNISLDADWENTLRNVGRYNMYMDGMEKLNYTTKYNYSLYQGGDAISGVVSNVYVAGENNGWQNAYVIETPDSKSFFVPSWDYDNGKIKKGDYVRVYSPPRKGVLNLDINKTNEYKIRASYKDRNVVDIFDHKSKTNNDVNKGLGLDDYLR